MKATKLIMAAAAVTVYVVFPAYRYYVIGSWVGLKIINNKPRPLRVIPKGSAKYNYLTGKAEMK